MTNADLNSAVEELNRTSEVSVYEASDVAWIAVIKIANLLQVTGNIRAANQASATTFARRIHRAEM